jgi:hypothetical protein
MSAEDAHDPYLTQKVLGQELTGAADLLNPTGKRGLLGAVESCVEAMSLGLKSSVIQERMRARDIRPESVTSMKQMLEVIGNDDVLRQEFADAILGSAVLYSDYLKYSDEAIRAVCGKGIDELFPGRPENATALPHYGAALRAGTPPLEIWRHARAVAGY